MLGYYLNWRHHFWLIMLDDDDASSAGGVQSHQLRQRQMMRFSRSLLLPTGVYFIMAIDGGMRGWRQ